MKLFLSDLVFPPKIVGTIHVTVTHIFVRAIGSHTTSLVSARCVIRE